MSPDPSETPLQPTPTPTTTDAPTTPAPEPTELSPAAESATWSRCRPRRGITVAGAGAHRDRAWSRFRGPRDPAVTSSTIPLGAIITALLVLVLAATALALLFRRNRASRPAGVPASAALEPAATTTEIGVLDDTHAVALPTEPSGDTVATVRFLMVLGEAMIDSSAPVVQVTRTLERVAAINGAPDVEVIALPTALLVSVPGQTSMQTAASSAGWRQLRLHQVQDVLGVADEAEAGTLDPVEGAARIETAVAAPPLYSGPVRVLGYVGVSAGLAMILGGSLVDVLVASVLGAAIAGLQVATVRLPAAYQALVVLSCAFVVSGAVFLLSRTGIDVGMLAPLVAPLVTFLPGRPAHHRGDRPGHPADDRRLGPPGRRAHAARAPGAGHHRRRRAGRRPRVRVRLRGVPAARLGRPVARGARLRHRRRVPPLRPTLRAAVDPARARRRLRRAGGRRAVLRRGVLRVHRGAAHDAGRDVRRDPPDRAARAGRVPAGLLAAGARALGSSG